MLVHMVFFYLKDEGREAARKQLEQDCERLLRKIPVVRQIWFGCPANTPRDVVDNSYDLGLCVIMDDRAAHDIYQDHPLHKEFVADNRPNFKRIQVYDFQ